MAAISLSSPRALPRLGGPAVAVPIAVAVPVVAGRRHLLGRRLRLRRVERRLLIEARVVLLVLVGRRRAGRRRVVGLRPGAGGRVLAEERREVRRLGGLGEVVAV